MEGNTQFPTVEEVQGDFAGDAGVSGGAAGAPGVSGGSSGAAGGSMPATGQSAAAQQGAAAPAGGQITQGPGDSEPMYEVTVGGRKWKVPVSELTKGYQRTQDYTRKTMELAEQRRNWEQERQTHMQQVEELQKWIQNPANVHAYLQQLQAQTGWQPGQPVAQPQIDINQIQQTIQEQMRNMQLQMETKQLTSQYKAEIDKAIGSALGTFGDLKLIDGIEELIRKDVAKRDPANIHEAVRLVAQVASGRAEALKSLRAQQVAQAAAQSSPLQNGIEPPGGTTPMPQPKAGDNLKMGSPEFMQAVLRDLANASVMNQ